MASALVSGPKAATTTSKGRTYGLELPPPDGMKSLWSVTTLISGGKPKPALLPWGIKATAEYAVANADRLYAMVKAAGGDPDALAGVVGWLKGAPYREREKKADLGTLFHEIAEAHALARPRPLVTPDVVPLVVQFERFLADWRPEYELAEATVYHVKESYAGTLDGIALMGHPARRLLLDYKTGKDVYDEVALQLAAYARAEGVYLGPGNVAPMPAVDGAVVIHVTAEGYRVVPVDIGDDVWRSFRYVREVFRYQDSLAKGVLGEPLSIPIFPVAEARRRRTRKAAAA
jgi:hypothetical protein